MTASDRDAAEGYERALELLRRASTPHGFVASVVDVDNYRRIWSRDGVIAGLAGLASEESELVDGLRRTLTTLADHQGPHGEIPSNVEPESRETSFGTLVGRVDAPLWFLIGMGRYVAATGDRAFASAMRAAAERTVFLLGCWEMNNRGLIYVPPGGDWADEYPLPGYKLYVQVLYHRALREFGETFANHEALQKAETIRSLLEAAFLPAAFEPPVRGRNRQNRTTGLAETSGEFYPASFSPTGYEWVFDGFANSLSLLEGIGPASLQEHIVGDVERLIDRFPLRLLPAYYPPIREGDPQWEALSRCCRFRFRNHPFEYHNGGLWPVISGFYAAALVRHHRRTEARYCLDAINAANRRGRSNGRWGFSEYLNGESGEPGGTPLQTWSAAGAVVAARALETGTPPL